MCVRIQARVFFFSYLLLVKYQMLLWIRVNTLEEFMALVFAAAVTTKDKGDKMKTVKGLK